MCYPFISKLVCFAYNWNVGMLEYWNTGILGFGKMESWVIVKFLLTGIKYRNVIFFKLSFQYSIIPIFHIRGKRKNLKKSYTFIRL